MKSMKSIMTLAFCPIIWMISDFACAQMRSPAEQEQYLLQRTADLGLDQLMDALGRSDEGNQNLVNLYGKLPAGKEPNSSLKAIRMDPRVRKIYGELSNMPAQEASEIVNRAFRSKFAAFQKGEIQRYGMHAALFLVFKFSPRDQFNKHFDEWNRWYSEKSSSIFENVANSTSTSNAQLVQESYHRAAAPETLMYLNLAVMDEIEKGKTVDQALGIVKSVFEGIVPAEYGVLDEATDISMQPLLPFDKESLEEAEPLVVIPEFRSWDGLDAMSSEQRSRITARIKWRLEGKISILAWPRLMIEATSEFLKNSAPKLRTLLEDTVRPMGSSFRTGVRVQFSGASLEKPLQDVWTEEEAPDKKELLVSMHKLYLQIPESKRHQWSERYREAREWINQVPIDGVKAENRFVIYWPPKDEKEAGIESRNDTDSDRKPSDSDTGPLEPTIWLEIVKASALMGKPLVLDRGDND